MASKASPAKASGLWRMPGDTCTSSSSRRAGDRAARPWARWPAEAFADASLPAAPQAGLVGATVRAQLGELDARTAADARTRRWPRRAEPLTAQPREPRRQCGRRQGRTEAGDTMTWAAGCPGRRPARSRGQQGPSPPPRALAPRRPRQVAASTGVAALQAPAASGAQTAASAVQPAASTAQSAPAAAQAAASGAAPKAAASTAAPAADVQLYAKDNAGNPLTTLVFQPAERLARRGQRRRGGAHARPQAARRRPRPRDFGARGVMPSPTTAPPSRPRWTRTAR